MQRSQRSHFLQKAMETSIFFGNLSARCKAMTCLSPFRVRLSALVILWKEIFYSVHRDFFLYTIFFHIHSSFISLLYISYQLWDPLVRILSLFYPLQFSLSPSVWKKAHSALIESNIRVPKKNGDTSSNARTWLDIRKRKSKHYPN